ncbi:DNA cross-link repair protein snm1 [Haematobia irritans]|uniref:DNA cross-link repair protein snm1 n=1 Tax=Haematobia irritans TaxID=7368 RepID=UPI003F508007
MINKEPKIRLRNLKELQCTQKLKAELQDIQETPVKTKKPRIKKAATTGTKSKKVTISKEEQQQLNTNEETVVAVPAKRATKSARKNKEPPPSQLRIDKFFKTCPKTYKIESLKEEDATPFRGAVTQITKRNTTTKKKEGVTGRTRMGRKCLFKDDNTSSVNSDDSCSKMKTNKEETTVEDCIDLISESDGDGEKEDMENGNKMQIENEQQLNNASNSSVTTFPKVFDSGTSRAQVSTSTSKSTRPLTSNMPNKTPATTTKRKFKPCPPYKVIEGTSFAVDAFQYGYIEGIDRYFLTHFHADHYIGLTKKFAMPLYMSTITARFVRTFIPVDDQYIHELELNQPIVVDGVEITALDANHCPGAIMILFKILSSNTCILHTGDFRACHTMEEEPVFWNNHINTIYLDTTYLLKKYAFCTQYESIDRAENLIKEFQEKHTNKKILYICGSYVIGKEKFWSALVNKFHMNVWTEDSRFKALKAMDDDTLNSILVDDPFAANMHVIAMGKISYMNLVEYFSNYQQHFDMCLAIRPSGWEKDSRPQYRGTINIVGVEYSEHSSYEEMKRFVKFLKPDKVISTVPTGRDLMETAKVPENWYKYEQPKPACNFQPCIEQFLGTVTPLRKSIIRMPNDSKGGVEAFVSPLKSRKKKMEEEINNNNNINHNNNNNVDETITITSTESISAYEFDPPLVLHKNHRNNKTSNSHKEYSPRALAYSQKQQIKEEKLEKSQSSKTKDLNLSVTVKKEIHQPTPTLKEGEMCSIYISNASSDYFEKPPTKNRNRRRILSTSSSEDVVISKKQLSNAKRKEGKRSIKQQTIPSTITEENEEDDVIAKENKNSSQDYLLEKPCTSKEALRRMALCNPLMKSTTTSCTSSINEEILPSQSSHKDDLIERPIRSRCSQRDIIPASQTTIDLENTPRPIRNKYKAVLTQNGNTTSHVKKTSKGKITAASNSQNEFIPASQTTLDLANTPRPLRNKRMNNTPLPTITSPAKKISNSKENSQPTPRDGNDDYMCFTQSQILTQVIKDKMIDIYNTSQLNSIVQEALSQQKLDTSTDHMPPELLSNLDAEDDWLD